MVGYLVSRDAFPRARVGVARVTSQVLHVLESPLVAWIVPQNREIDFCNCSASDLGWVGYLVSRYAFPRARVQVALRQD